MKLKYLVTTVCFALLFSCAEDKNADKNSETINSQSITNTATINNTSWMVINLKEQKEFTRNPSIHFDFSENKISGSTGCNKFFGGISIEDNQMIIKNISSTKMMCRNIEMESLFLKTLNDVSTYKIKDSELHLLASNNEVLMKCSQITE